MKSVARSYEFYIQLKSEETNKCSSAVNFNCHCKQICLLFVLYKKKKKKGRQFNHDFFFLRITHDIFSGKTKIFLY